MIPERRPGLDPGRQLALIWGAIVVALALLAPLAPVLARSLPRCPLKTLTDVPCPTCGSGRAALALARLDPAAAIRATPLGAGAMLAFGVGGVVAMVRFARGGGVNPHLMLSRPWRVALAVAIVANWVWLVVDGR